MDRLQIIINPLPKVAVCPSNSHWSAHTRVQRRGKIHKIKLKYIIYIKCIFKLVGLMGYWVILLPHAGFEISAGGMGLDPLGSRCDPKTMHDRMTNFGFGMKRRAGKSTQNVFWGHFLSEKKVKIAKGRSAQSIRRKV